MGEIRIKSGNLFDLEHYINTAITHNMEIAPIKNGIRLTSTSSNDPFCNSSFWNIGLTISLDDRKTLLSCKPNTKYTIMLNQTAIVRKIVSYVDENFKSVKNFTSFDGEAANIQTPENCVYIILRIGNESTMPEGTTVELTNIRLYEGTYTSETIPEYQPYFLNRPAHQFTNGQFVDIPTHHFTNGRWQGELTSQSPLKFRADGEMLDWRIEGKTSGNLFDTSIYNNTVGSIRCTVTSTLNSITIEATDRDPYVGAYLPEGTSISVNFRSLYIPVKPNTTYTINMSSAPKCYWLKVDENDISRGGGEIGTLPFSFTTDEFTKYVTIRFGNGNLQEGDSFTIENIQLIEGTYTTSTIPPYEPYGGVGDWDETEQKYKIPITVNGVTTNLYTDHQLMDGDSLDFAIDQTSIPITQGNNTLTVGTTVKPKSVFVKFEG